MFRLHNQLSFYSRLHIIALNLFFKDVTKKMCKARLFMNAKYMVTIVVKLELPLPENYHQM